MISAGERVVYFFATIGVIMVCYCVKLNFHMPDST